MASNTNTENKNKDVMSDDPSTSEEDEVQTPLRVTEEERRGTIPGSTQATAMALTFSRAQANPVVERSKPRKTKKKNTSNTSTKQASTQTDQTPK